MACDGGLDGGGAQSLVDPSFFFFYPFVMRHDDFPLFFWLYFYYFFPSHSFSPYRPWWSKLGLCEGVNSRRCKYLVTGLIRTRRLDLYTSIAFVDIRFQSTTPQ